VVIPLDVARQWWTWLEAGRGDLIKADLVRVLADAGRPDPPSSVDPNISTR
jgi:hypothetical protein